MYGHISMHCSYWCIMIAYSMHEHVFTNIVQIVSQPSSVSKSLYELTVFLKNVRLITAMHIINVLLLAVIYIVLCIFFMDEVNFYCALQYYSLLRLYQVNLKTKF